MDRDPVAGGGGFFWRSNGIAHCPSLAVDVEVGISDGTAAYIDVNSKRGAVRNSVASPSPESPDASGATVMVHARTRHGDIIIQRAAS